MQKNKKVALLITRMLPGGAATVVRDIILRSDSGFSFSLYCGAEDLNELCVEDLKKKAVVLKIDSMVRRISPYNDFLAFFSLLREFRKHKFDVLHTHTSKAGFIGRMAGWLAGIPVIIHSTHGSIYAENANIPGVSKVSFIRNLLLMAERFVGLFSNRITVLSNAEKELSIKLGIAVAEKICVIHNGIDTCKFKKTEEDRRIARKNLALSDSDFYIVSVGRLSVEKGHKILIGVFRRILSENPDRKILLGIAGDGPLKEEIERDNKDIVKDGKLFLYGYSSDVRRYLFAADLFVLPSLYEGFGIALLEAMAAGITIMAGNVGGIPELVGDDIDGFLYPPMDTEKLYELIRENIGRERDMEKSQANVLRADFFNVNAMVEKYYEMYK